MEQKKFVYKKKEFLEKSLLRRISNQRSNYASSSVDNKSQNPSNKKPFIVSREFSSTHMENKIQLHKAKAETGQMLRQEFLGTG